MCQDVFIIGSKGIPAKYGGFETFVEKLTEKKVSPHIRYHIACAVDEAKMPEEYTYNGAHCFEIKWRKLGAARAITYDLDALSFVIRYIRKHHIEHPIVYVLACRIGPFIGYFANQIHAFGGLLFVNPDGHEWMRAKWSAPIKRYWKISEKGMIKHADLVVCDSKTIERYIQQEYARYHPKTIYIAYGADTDRSLLKDDSSEFIEWLNDKNLVARKYYLIVGRFVPENNYETMIREFMMSDTPFDLAIITDDRGPLFDRLERTLHISQDPRIKFVGAVYDQQLLKKIRESAYAYLHGHEVGGTNPSLLEALASTRLNLLLDVGFNCEVAADSALYWNKETGNLKALISSTKELSEEALCEFDRLSLERVQNEFSWTHIIAEYETLFENAPLTERAS